MAKHRVRNKKALVPVGPVTVAAARRHEAVHVRLEALLRLVGPIAARRPDQLVSDASRALAEGILADAAPFMASSDRLPDGGARAWRITGATGPGAGRA